MPIKNINDFALWEGILDQEWLWDIDKKEGFSEIPNRVDRVLGAFNRENFFKKISEIEERNSISIRFYEDSLILLDGSGNEIGFIKKWHYSYHGLEKASHLESVIHDQYRSNGYGRLMFELFERYGRTFDNCHFRMPKIEFSHKKSMINFLVKYFDYKVVGKYIDGERIEVFEIDEDDFCAQEDELCFTYELQRNRK